MNSELLKLARERELLKPYGKLDVLLLYGIIAPYLERFLGPREIATKIHIPGFRAIIKRGTKLEPLRIQELVKGINTEFLELRSNMHLKDAKGKITKIQEKIWRYFVPRKYVEFFYATNFEKGSKIARIYFDIDRGAETKFSDAVLVTREFFARIKESELASFVSEFLISYTGSSFHIEANLKEPQELSFYNEYLSTRDETKTIIKKIVNEVNEALEIRVLPEHVRERKAITIDPSQTPPGKLDRIPLGCLHINKEKIEVDGISLPVSEKMLFSEEVYSLQSYTPEKFVEEIKKFTPIEKFYIRPS